MVELKKKLITMLPLSLSMIWEWWLRDGLIHIMAAAGKVMRKEAPQTYSGGHALMAH